MKKIVIAGLIVLGGMLTSVSYQQTEPKVEYVYICNGSKAVCYHKTNTCNGIKNCSKEITKITKKEALEIKGRPCKLCY
ncbi:MAG: hypothetical protein LBL13_07370 [Bacteroidales bacterium]|jgi:hypothetical protein|nr:hypothetical protein [Bacteroidales bacterium]